MNKSNSRWLWLIVGGCLLVILIALFLPREHRKPNADRASTNEIASGSAADASHVPRARFLQRSARSEAAPSPTAEEIVASKVRQFSHNRRALAHAMADRVKIAVPSDVERFFAAVETGHWNEIDSAFKPLADRYNAKPRPHDIDILWGPILETLGAAESAHDWPAQKLLDYGDAVLSSLRPGMVYVGGTDPGRFIPTLLNETTDGERHIIVTQNGLGASSYLDYLNFLYSDRLTTLTHEDSNRAFQEYLADFQQRLAHDQQFPDEPRQVLPGENNRAKRDGTSNFTITSKDGLVGVSGDVAIMAVNERLLQMLLQKNPELSFAIEQSFPLKSTYADATPLGPIMELRVQDSQNVFTAERAAQSVDYWRTTAQQLLADPEAAGSLETRMAYAKMAFEQASLLLDHHYSAEAEQSFRLANEICPSSSEAAFRLSDLLTRSGRANEAAELLEDFARRNPEKRAAVEEFRQSHPGRDETAPKPPSIP